MTCAQRRAKKGGGETHFAWDKRASAAAASLPPVTGLPLVDIFGVFGDLQGEGFAQRSHTIDKTFPLLL